MSERVAAPVAEAKTANTATRAVRPSLSPARTALLQCACACGQSTAGKCNECDQEKKKQVLQAKSNGAPQPSSIPPIVNDALGSRGRPLDSGTRSAMESRFGEDFSGVRIHDDSLAAESARAVNARAYTVGEDIAFASGQYDPHSHEGSHLLAHELAHTVQQRGLQRSSDGVSMNHDSEYVRLEREADSAAAAVTQGMTPSLTRSASQPVLSRAGDGTVAPAKSTAPQPKQSSLGGTPTKHIVTPTEVYTTPGQAKTIEEFEVDFLYMPGTKGPKAKEIYEAMAGKDLESTVKFEGTGKTKTALWQEREPTQELRSIWIQKVGWQGGNVDDLWSRCGGGKTFPQVGAETCHMDHIVELQLNGNNATHNIQPLNPTPNTSSGSSLKGEVQTLALAILKDPTLSSGNTEQMKLRWMGVQVVGPMEQLPKDGECPIKPAGKPTCLRVEECAKRLPIVKSPTGSVSVARVDYPIYVGGRPPINLRVPATFAGRAADTATIHTDSENDPQATLIPGMLLQTLSHRKGQTAKPDQILATIDDRDKTRLPLTLDKTAKPFMLVCAEDGKLTLAAKSTGLGFTYKYLSPGKITSIGVDEAGKTTWKGVIKPKIPFLGQLDVEYSNEKLSVTKGLDEAALKRKQVLGMRLTEAKIGLDLAPEFKPWGTLAMELGPTKNPIATAALKIEKDEEGIVATGKIKANIPKMETSETTITYKGGGGRNDWNATINIESKDIKLGSSISVTGGFVGTLEKGALNFTGKINASLPGDNKAQLGLKKIGNQWILFGGGKFKIPKLDETNVNVTYNLGSGTLTATGSTGFTIEAIDLRGKLEKVTFTYTEGKPLQVTGTGLLKFKRGKAEGNVNVTLHPNGKFSGSGSLSYQLKENMIVKGTVELDKNEKLTVKGELTITRFELFRQYKDERDLFKTDFSIPVPGLSLGKLGGLMVTIGGGVSVSFSFGPGTIEPLKFSAGFDPLEEDPNYELTVSGTARIPASARLSAYITGAVGIELNAVVAKGGVQAGLKLQGDLILRADAFAKLDASYKNKKFAARVDAGIDTKLYLGLSLSAFLRAYAETIGWDEEAKKEWTLAQRKIDTGLGLFVSAPFIYADDKLTLPTAKDIEFRKPQFTMDNMKRIVNEIFNGAQSTETKT